MITDERKVVFRLPELKKFVMRFNFSKVLPYFHTQIIWIQSHTRGLNDLTVHKRKFQRFSICKIKFMHDSGMPECSPSFINDFSLNLRIEIKRFLANYTYYISCLLYTSDAADE